ncbi:MAG: hypothetical protein MR450_02310 [Prevotella sp.]|nr:hypothetical protein [Prevotella sp.]MDY4038890.1 hypothetical protein [Prevotella sp.]
MKKLLLSLILICAVASSVPAQDIYNEVKHILQEVEKIKYDTSKNIEDRKIAAFKWDAIYYMIMKAAADDKFTEVELGKQTNAMIDFVNSFTKRYAQASRKSDREALTAAFKKASLSYPLFNDNEKDIVNAYVDNPKFITQFSIDCNWVRALEAVK